MASYTSLTYHIVFSTEHRRPIIHRRLESELHSLFGSLFRERDGLLIAAGGVEDHVHLLGRIRPRHAVAEVIRDLKSFSSGWLGGRVPEFSWQLGYGAFSVSRSSEAGVTAYIRKQREHHRRRSSRDEFLQLLTAHDIEPDPRDPTVGEFIG
ncbi:MAG TPA: IS200/IS605 family transposase [Pirellulaceae bacterium]|nr:IS200/IS605 family transposase [Pirellulaceae bacterium]